MSKSRTALTPELLTGIAVSVLAHGLLFGAKGFYRPAQACTDRGTVAVELTLMPSMAAMAAPPPDLPKPTVTPPPEPVAAPTEEEKVPVPQPQPETPPQPEVQAEPEPQPESPAAEESVNAVEQDGSMKEDQGSVTEAQTQTQCSPVYPGLSRRRGEEGIVVLSVDVSATGEGTNIQLIQSSGHARLDKAALKALASARFIPAIRFGRPVASTLTQTFNFRLTDD